MKDRRVASFLALVFGSTWTIAGLGALAGVRATSGISYIVLAAACMLLPGACAIIQQRLIDRAPWNGLGLSFRSVNWRGLVLTALVGVLIIPSALFIIHLAGDHFHSGSFGHASLSADRMHTIWSELLMPGGKDGSPQLLAKLKDIPGYAVLLAGLIAALGAACTVNLPFMLGEELGWRGYLFQVTISWKPLYRILLTGIVWGLWHAPLVLMGHNYPEHPLLGVPLMVVFCTLLAFLFDWSRSRTNAVWGPCLLHGIINGSAGMLTLFAWGGHPLVMSLFSMAGFIALAVLICVILVADRRFARSLLEDSPDLRVPIQNR